MTSIHPCTLDDARYIATNLRQADRRECEALLGLPPEIALPASLIPNRRVRTLVASTGEVLGMGGVDPSAVTGVGLVWFVGTDAIKQHQWDFMRDSLHYVQWAHEEFPILTNFVDARNTLHHRWLKWLGFVFLKRIEKWGAQSVPFIEFARHRSCA